MSRCSWEAKLDSRDLGHTLLPKNVECMTVRRISASTIAADFSAALYWMAGLGINCETGRLRKYSESIARWSSMQANDDDFVRHTLSTGDRSAILEAAQFTDVYLAFKSTPAQDLKAIIGKLKKAVSGPPDAQNESENSSTARNFLFEAVLAAKTHCPNQGVHVTFDSPGDSGLVFHSRRIAIECKRLRSLNKLDTRVRDACNQLSKAINGGPPHFDYGMVAVELSRILAMNQSLRSEESVAKHSAAALDEFIATHSNTWQKVYREKDSRILGTIFRVSCFIQSETDGLWILATEWALNPRNHSGCNKTRIMKRLAMALDQGANSR